MTDYKIPFATTPVPEYESPYQLKKKPPSQIASETDYYPYRLYDMDSFKKWESYLKHQDAKDDHYQWTRLREAYATAALGIDPDEHQKMLEEMLEHVTETSPPDAPKRRVPASRPVPEYTIAWDNVAILAGSLFAFGGGIYMLTQSGQTGTPMILGLVGTLLLVLSILGFRWFVARD